MTENPFYVKLANRGLIRLQGEDCKPFLQGLITNDIYKLTAENILYACLLTPQGKFLHDFFLHNNGDTILIDCEGGNRAQDLYDRLIKFRLRKKIQISVEENVKVYSILLSQPSLMSSQRKLGSRATSPLDSSVRWNDTIAPDPRHESLGHRTFIKPDLPECDFKEWDRRRIELTIPDGSRDLIPEKSTMDEGNMDQINAIDYEKGCYIGQELTARMHYRGLGKRFLQTVTLADHPDKEIRSQCGDIGIALIKK